MCIRDKFQLRKFGAIDIGSNAIRLLISSVYQEEEKLFYKKVALIRLPIRLGQEAFLNKKISRTICERFLHGMQAYGHLLKVHNVESYRACATSAMRDAKNGKALAEQARELAGIEIEIIPGKEEAQIIHEAHFKEKINPDVNYIYVDVGGGSTEITLLKKGEVADSRSFKIGTLRVLNNIVKEGEWERMEEWIKSTCEEIENPEMIGSGGNITKLYKLTQSAYPTPMSLDTLNQIGNKLSTLTTEERIKNYKLNEDRADVIVPAFTIYSRAMEWSESSTIHVPKIGLSDGIIQEQATRYFAENQ